MTSTKVWMSWSSGKDSAYALLQLMLCKSRVPTTLLTVVDTAEAHVPMHHTPLALLQRQADALGLPLHIVDLPAGSPNSVYEAAMRDALHAARSAGVTEIAFGDIFLEDLKAYREARMANTGLTAIFPLWQQPTPQLARAVIAAGIRAIVTSINLAALPAAYLGRAYDERFLDDLPPGVDPCGENGEFHTFVYDAPMFAAPIPVHPRERSDQAGHAHLALGLGLARANAS